MAKEMEGKSVGAGGRNWNMFLKGLRLGIYFLHPGSRLGKVNNEGAKVASEIEVSTQSKAVILQSSDRFWEPACNTLEGLGEFR